MSRIIIKNLPKNATEKELRSTFEQLGNITDVKLVCRDGVFRGYAFMGFENSAEAELAVGSKNKTYFNTCKIAVEIAKDLGDASRPKAWSQKKEEQNEVQVKREDQERLRIQLSHLRQAGNDLLKTNALLAKYKDDPKFRQYLELTAGKSDLLQRIEDLENKEFKDKQKRYEDHSEEDEGIVEDQDKLAKKQEISDASYWQTLTQAGDKEDEKSKEASTLAVKKKQWKELHTIRLRIEKFPKKGARISGSDAKSKKIKKGLTKQDVKNFFKPLNCQSIRINKKNRFEFFIGFASEKVVQQALKKNGSILLGVRVKLTDLSSTAPAPVEHGKGSAPWAEAEARLERTEPVAESGRLFIRNLSYLVTEERLREKCAAFGEIAEFDLPICKQTRKPKGFATVTYLCPTSAVAAMNDMDGSELMGRLVHVLPALPEEQLELQRSGNTSSFKKEKEQQQKANATSWHNWNTLFVSSAAVADIMAKKFNKTKEQILDSEGPQSAAVTLALGETQIVNEMKTFLEEHGVSVEAFTDPTVERSDTVLLVKNLPAGTKATDIAELFGKWGELGRVVLPPSGVTCIVEYLSATEARKALRNMHYKKFGHVPLYLEKAPLKTFLEEYKKPQPKEVEEEEEEKNNKQEERGAKRKVDEENDASEDEEEGAAKKKAKTSTAAPEDHTTVYVQNLPLDITEEDIRKHFSRAGEVFSVIVAMKGLKSRGYGFVQFLKQREARNALVTLEGSTLGDRNLSLKLSEKKLTTNVKTARQMQDFGEQTSSKISVKNIPFQATKIEIDQLFRPFGALKRVFLQKHHTGQYNNGGYGFVEYLNVEDSKRALQTLGMSTHLLGRRLVLQWAKEDETVDEIRQKTAQKQQFVESLGTNHKKMRHSMREMQDKKTGSDH